MNGSAANATLEKRCRRHPPESNPAADGFARLRLHATRRPAGVSKWHDPGPAAKVRWPKYTITSRENDDR